MSISINVDKVKSVMFGNQWFHVKDDSFFLDSYEFTDNSGMSYLGGGQDPLVPATGFSFVHTDGRRISGPLTALQAVIE